MNVSNRGTEINSRANLVLVVSPALGAAVVLGLALLASPPWVSGVPEMSILLLVYWSFTGFVAGALSGVINRYVLANRAAQTVGFASTFGTKVFGAIIGWGLTYPLFFLRQSEYSPLALTVLPALLFGGLTALFVHFRNTGSTHATQRQESHDDVEPVEPRTRRSFVLLAAAALILTTGVAASLVATVVFELIPLRLSGAPLGEAIGSLPLESVTQIWFRLGIVGLWTVALVGAAVVTVATGRASRVSEVVIWVLLSGASVLVHAWWLAGAISSSLFWHMPEFNAVPDPNPYSEFLWVLEIVGWLMAITAFAIVVGTARLRRQPRPL